ncbi:flagellar biosynthesis protein FliQ [Lachnospiraceae bacterium KM106-2]|nr:flagellar biosynthesis protein FliQ [Lachnospiraceae bacterium KM106-2]
MTQDAVIEIATNTVWIILKTSAPLLIISLVVGLIISIFQTVTSIQEQTLTFVPKLVAILIMIVIFGEWMMNNIVEFFVQLVTNMSSYIR